MKKALKLLLILALSAQTNLSMSFDKSSSFELNQSYFLAVENQLSQNSLPEYYKPRSLNPLIAVLPEYYLKGPGYICDTHQAPPVYRFPVKYLREVGYREADWFNNHLKERRAANNINFGGY